MLRNDVPPPAPAVMPSMSRPACLNMPFSSATAHGNVATKRPYWLTVILAAKAGVMARLAAIAALANRARNRIMLPHVDGALIARCVCKPCTLGFQPPARLPPADQRETGGNAMRIVHGDQVEEKIRLH